jgi:hypothetical protein
MPQLDPVNEEGPITIRYALTRMEITGYFLRSIPQSPRLLLIVIGSSLVAGAASLAASGASLRAHPGAAILNACGLALGVFCFFVFLVFIQAKTRERTLTVSAQGISTAIGATRATIPWSKIATVKSVGRHVLIVRTTGNSFLVPMRAFEDSRRYARFLEMTQEWLTASR